MYKGVGDGRGVAGVGGKPKPVTLSIGTQTVVLCLQ